MCEHMKTIKTKDFALRHPKAKDVDGYYETETDPVSKKMFMSFPESLNEAEKDLQKHIKDNAKRPIVSETFSVIIDGAYAGYTKIQFQNFDSKSEEGRVHIAIHPRFRGKGLATKVIRTITSYGFKRYRFKRIFAQCKLKNNAVARVIEKAGFRLEKIHTIDGVQKMWWVLERKKGD